MRRLLVRVGRADPGTHVVGIELLHDSQGIALSVGLWTRNVVVLWWANSGQGDAVVAQVENACPDSPSYKAKLRGYVSERRHRRS